MKSTKIYSGIPRFISFFGPDGAGKTTHVGILLDYLKAGGRRVRKVWIRSPHTLASLLYKLFIRLGLYRTASNPFGMSHKIPRVDENLFSRNFWSILEFISVVPLILLKVYLPLVLGYTIVAERYVVDTIAGIGYYIGDKGFLHSAIARILLSFIPRGAVFIFLDSDYATIVKRRGHIAHPRDSIEFQRMTYRILARHLGAATIDTSELSIEQASMKIKEAITNISAQS